MKKILKKRMLSALLIFSLLAFLTSCGYIISGGDSEPGDNNASGEEENGMENYIYGEGLVPAIVCSASENGAAIISSVNSIKLALEKKTGGSVATLTDSDAEARREIVLGSTERAISGTAEERLTKSLKRAAREGDGEEELIGYAIYAEGSSVAVVWSDGCLVSLAAEDLIGQYLDGESLELPDGYFRSEVMNRYDYLELCDKKAADEEWAGVEAVLGTDAAEALRAHYAMFDERFYLWLADLYDPDVGGFYYSNSARDALGFLPDIESTAQVLAFLNNSGMTKGYAGGWAEALPEKTKDAIAAFVKGLQSEKDGYFYHPQWEGRSYTTSRLGRDVTWAGEILSPLYAYYSSLYKAEGYSDRELDEMLKKYMPYWNTPAGLKGSLGAPGSTAASLTEGICGKSAAAAVAKVVRTAENSTWTPQLRSLDAWRAYLYGGKADGVTFAGYDLAKDSYTAGNAISSQVNQIKNREQEAKSKGEPTGYVALTLSYFESAMNSANGLWEPTVTYNSVNGFMKISGLYNNMGWELRYPELSLNSAIYIATLADADLNGAKPQHSVDVYNPWVAISNIFTNLELYSSIGNSVEVINRYRATLVNNAAAMISGTSLKTAAFAKDDGSYGYTWGAPPVNSQGMPVSVDGVVGGDVNGGCVASTGIILNMCKALGIADIKPCLFRCADLQRFLDRLSVLEGVIKNEPVATEVTVYGFEDDTVGKDSYDVQGLVSGGERFVAQRDEKPAANLQMLTVRDTDPSKGVTTTLTAQGEIEKKASAYVVEFDIFFSEVGRGSLIQLKLGAGERASYMMTLTGREDGSVALGDSSSTDSKVAVTKSFGITLEAKAWHTVRIEYYKGNADTVRTKIFIGGKLRFVSDNYYGKLDGERVEPGDSFEKVSFYSTYDSVMSFNLDNVTCARTADKYREEEIWNPDRIKTFEGLQAGALPKGISVSGASVTADPYNVGNSVLVMPAGSVARITPTVRSSPSSVFVYESDLLITAESSGEVLKLTLGKGGASGAVLALSVCATVENGEKALSLSFLTEDGSLTKAAELPFGSSFRLRVEYYRYQYNENYTKSQAIVYINGKISARTVDMYSVYNVGVDYTEARITRGASQASVYLDNIIAELDRIAFIDGDGNPVSDPAEPAFPTGGAGSSTPTGEGYIGRLDFDEAAIGIPSVEGLTTVPNSREYGNDIEIAKNPDGEGNALLVSTRASSRAGNSFRVIPFRESSAANCYVLEWNMYISKGSKPYYQIRLGDCFMLTLNANRRLGLLTKTSNPSDGSGRYESPLCVTVAEDTWTNIRIEYYHGTADTVVIRVFVNGEMVSESDRFYGRGSAVVGTPSGLYNESNPAFFYSGYDSEADVYFDGISAVIIEKEFVPSEGENPGQGEEPKPEPEEPKPEFPESPILPDDPEGEINVGDGFKPPVGAPNPDDVNGNWSSPNG